MNCAQIYLTLALACHLIVAGCYASAPLREYRTSAASQEEEEAIDGLIQAMSRKVLQRSNDQVGLSSMDNELSARTFNHFANRHKNPMAKLNKMKTAEQFIRFIVTLVVPDVLKALLNNKQIRKNLGLGRKLSSSSASSDGNGENFRSPPSAVEKAVAKWREGAKKPKLALESGEGHEVDNEKNSALPMGSLEAATKAGERVKGIVPSSLVKPAGDQVKRMGKSMLGNKNSFKEQSNEIESSSE